jgi:hypothetical protein
MGEMRSDYHETPPVQAVFDCAKQFGLTDGEVLRTVNECLCEADSDASVAEFLDELTGVLARNILHKEQHTLSKEQGARSEERRARSRESL